VGSLKLVEPFDELPVQLLSMKLIEVLPELQPRAEPPGRHMQKYYQDMLNGDAFPPIHVFELPDGRMVLSDGHTRFGARAKLAKDRRCEWNIRAYVHKGTMLDALDYAVKANGDEFHRGKKYEEEDRRKAAALYIRRGVGKPEEESWGWSDNEIARRCGLNGGTVAKQRLALFESEGIPLPDRVWRFRDGVKTSQIKYKHSSTTSRHDDGRVSAHIGGKQLRARGENAEAELESRRLEVASTKIALAKGCNFRRWLGSRSVHSFGLGLSEFKPGGLRVGCAYIATFSEARAEPIQAAICRGMLALYHLKWVKRAAVVGYRDGSGLAGVVLDLAAAASPPVEHMTPEEFVERALAGEFGETPADATTDDPETVTDD
jgi:transposase-like protein